MPWPLPAVPGVDPIRHAQRGVLGTATGPPCRRVRPHVPPLFGLGFLAFFAFSLFCSWRQAAAWPMVPMNDDDLLDADHRRRAAASPRGLPCRYSAAARARRRRRACMDPSLTHVPGFPDVTKAGVLQRMRTHAGKYGIRTERAGRDIAKLRTAVSARSPRGEWRAARAARTGARDIAPGSRHPRAFQGGPRIIAPLLRIRDPGKRVSVMAARPWPARGRFIGHWTTSDLAVDGHAGRSGPGGTGPPAGAGVRTPKAPRTVDCGVDGAACSSLQDAGA